MSERHIPGIAILASGSGSTAEEFIHATLDGRVNAEVRLVICNNPPKKAYVYERIDRLNKQYRLDIETLRINGVTHPSGPGDKGELTLEESSAICVEVQEADCGLVSLMGYMKKVRGELLEEYGWWPGMSSYYQARMINTHPGPLPETASFYGIHVQEEVLRLGLENSAHTMHLVSEEYDKGPIIHEYAVPVLADDSAESLFDRVQIVEKKWVPQVTQGFLRGMESFRADG